MIRQKTYKRSRHGILVTKPFTALGGANSYQCGNTVDRTIAMQHWLVCPLSNQHQVYFSASWTVVNTLLTPCLLQLYWLPVRWHVQFKLCCITHYGTCPAYLTDIVESTDASRTCSGLRSTLSTDYTLPWHKIRWTCGLERSACHGWPSGVQKTAKKHPFSLQLICFMTIVMHPCPCL